MFDSAMLPSVCYGNSYCYTAIAENMHANSITVTIAACVQAYKSPYERILDPDSRIMNLKLQGRRLILLSLKINTEKQLII